ncbi:MAG: hypothetical protein II942_04300 [Alphaproteobacteria bacterium]|nr:hypothetical protein [Alphaproteobacteria bacterium]
MSIFELSVNIKDKPIKPAKRATAAPKAAAKPATPQSPADLEKLAMEAMSDLTSKFPAWASGDVQTVKTLLAQAYGAYDTARTDIIRQQVYPKVHDLKGQGTTFGYPLITDIGTHMCALITNKTKFSNADVVTLKNDALMMETVLWKKLKGDGGPKGADILRKLRK